MEVEWHPIKAATNRQKHGVDFADAVAALEDSYALSRPDLHPAEVRMRRGRQRHANAGSTRRTLMRKEHDFSKARRGSVLPAPTGKTRITIRLDDDVLDWFRARVHAAGGGNYQTLINQALRSVMDQALEPLETVVRRVVREELQREPGRGRRRSGTDRE